MLNVESAIKLLKDRPNWADCYVVFPIVPGTTDSDVRSFLRDLKSQDYQAYLRLTEIGNEVVVIGFGKVQEDTLLREE
jgi:hypothetical protein